MDDFEKNNSGDNLTEQTENNSEKEHSEHFDIPASGNGNFTFNDDGTYHFSRSGDSTGETAQTGSTDAGNDRSTEQSSYKRETAYPYGNDSYPYRDSVNEKQDPYPYQSGHSNDYGTGVKAKSNKGGKIFAGLTAVLIVVLVATLAVTVIGSKKANKVTPGSNDAQIPANENVGELVTAESPEAVGKPSSKGELTAKEIYNKVLGSSVGILVYGSSDKLSSEGSGVLFKEDNDGKYTYIVTCAHVISDARSGGVFIQLYDEREYKAEVVGFDVRTDIGVLRIEASGLELAQIGDSSKLAVGDDIYAIGNPGGVEFANSFTNGMVSALDRPVNSSSSGYTMECIQHTAAINPGNSGGALVNVFGQVIGINSMKIVDDEYEGMGFSVPSSVFVNIVNNIIEHGYVANRPKLGITYVSAQNYNSYGMFVAIKELPSGSIVIYSISDDSSLKDTEAREGDMIVAVNGKDLDDASMLPELIENSNVGDVITLSLIRINKDYSYQEFDVKVTLAEDRGDTVSVPETTASQNPNDYFRDYFDDFFSDFFN